MAETKNDIFTKLKEKYSALEAEILKMEKLKDKMEENGESEKIFAVHSRIDELNDIKKNLIADIETDIEVLEDLSGATDSEAKGLESLWLKKMPPNNLENSLGRVQGSLSSLACAVWILVIITLVSLIVGWAGINP